MYVKYFVFKIPAIIVHQLCRIKLHLKYLCCSIIPPAFMASQQILPMLFQLAYAGRKQGWQWITI